MAQYALVDGSGHVVNMVEWDGVSSWKPPAGSNAVLATQGVGPGWTYTGGVFVAPVLPPPVSPIPLGCQLWQLQSVLTTDQWTAVLNVVAGLNNPALTAFSQHGTNFIPATSTTLLQIGEAIGLTPSQVTALVTQASQVSIP